MFFINLSTNTFKLSRGQRFAKAINMKIIYLTILVTSTLSAAALAAPAEPIISGQVTPFKSEALHQNKLSTLLERLHNKPSSQNTSQCSTLQLPSGRTHYTACAAESLK